MTRVQEVVGSNPGAVYWMDIFHIHLLLKLYCLLEKDQEKTKRGRGWSICFKKQSKKRSGLAHLKNKLHIYETLYSVVSLSLFKGLRVRINHQLLRVSHHNSCKKIPRIFPITLWARLRLLQCVAAAVWPYWVIFALWATFQSLWQQWFSPNRPHA